MGEENTSERCPKSLEDEKLMEKLKHVSAEAGRERIERIHSSTS